MSNSAKTRREPAIPTAPSWLSRPEKLLFKRLIGERRAAGKSVSAIDEAVFSDLAMARSRLRELRRMLAEAHSEISEIESDRAYALQLFKEIDRVTRLTLTLSDRITR